MVGKYLFIEICQILDTALSITSTISILYSAFGWFIGSSDKSLIQIIMMMMMNEDFFLINNHGVFRRMGAVM